MATQTIKMRIQFRRDTTENWLLNKDVIPAAGEPCYDLDLKTLKIGDGTTTYENLPAIGNVNVEELQTIVNDLQADVSSLQEIVTPSAEDAIPLLARVETLEVKMDGTGEGSVDAKIDAKIKSFAESMTADGKVNTLMELINYVESHGTEAADMAADIKELQENVIREIAVNGTLLDIVDGRVDISIAEQTLGVKSSDEIDVAEDGTLSIKSISIDKIVQNEDDYIIMDGGGAA